jgi:MoaA/NifB/PqqE/SkfB family radical SAM enzyme
MNQVSVTKLNPITNIDPFNKSFHVLWLIDKRCNFDCSYCPDKWHSKPEEEPVSLETMKSAWKKIIKATEGHQFKTYDICLQGGEPTINKDFLPFVTWLDENYSDRISNIGSITNGTASVSYYKKLIKRLNWVTFSVHTEFMNEKKFFDTVLKVDRLSKLNNKRCLVNVNIMNELWNLERVKKYQSFLNKHDILNYLHPIHDFRENKKQYPIKLTNKFNFND